MKLSACKFFMQIDIFMLIPTTQCGSVYSWIPKNIKTDNTRILSNILGPKCTSTKIYLRVFESLKKFSRIDRTL
jgi:hypothetical protein